MKLGNLEDIVNPIIYIALALVLSSISYGIMEKYWWLAVLSVGLFFIGVFLQTNFIFTAVILGFYIIGMLYNINYYNPNIDNNFKGEVRITKSKAYYKIGEYKGRQFYIENSNNEKVGDKIYIVGKFEKNQYREKGIVGNISVKNQEKVSNRDFIQLLYGVREKIYNKFKENLGQRKASIVTSVSFGYSDYMDTEDEEDMRTLGVIHAISVSGLHIALIFSVLNKKINKGISFLITFIYVLFTGAAFSSLRALVMIGTMVLAFNVRKKYTSLSGLALSAIIITLYKPYAPLQLGFILSFLATLGIIIFSKSINKRLYKLPKYLRETIAISLSAQTLALPVLLATFKEMSITFILGNLLVVPIFNVIIILGNLSIFLMLIPNAFDFISYVLMKVINFTDNVVSLLLDISQNTLIVNEEATMVYILCLIAMFYIAKGYKKFVWLPVIGIIVAMIQVYSPILKIDYLREGGILISYKGDKKIVTNKKQIDIAKLKKQTLAKEAIREGKKIYIENGVRIEAENKNFILKVGDKSYFIKLNNKSKTDSSCDIINFVDGYSRGLYIIDHNVITY